jgi:8-oxo-dGTP diphosphatase
MNFDVSFCSGKAAIEKHTISQYDQEQGLTRSKGIGIFCHYMPIEILQKIILGLMVTILTFNLTQRRHLEHGETKRFATLGLAGLFLVNYIGTIIVLRFSLSSVSLLAPLFLSVLLGVGFRERIFIFHLRCGKCGEPLLLKQILYHDTPVCTSCAAPRSVEDIDWENWIPEQKAVVCYTVADGKVLLIHKKTGLGAGKVNAPGGRIEQGETPIEATVREYIEEVGLTPHNVLKQAELSFIFTDGFSLHCTVFFADSCTGEMIETEEADPFWCDLQDIPYDEMWQDDELWLPPALAGKKQIGRFIFDNDTMLSNDIREVSSFDDSENEN